MDRARAIAAEPEHRDHPDRRLEVWANDGSARQRAVEAAGAFAVVLECVPKDLAREVTQALSIPTIGIGAGVGDDHRIGAGGPQQW